MKRVLLIAILCLATLYAADFGIVKLRPNGIGSVTVQRVYVIPLKNGKTEYTSEETVEESCVRSMLPHGGNPTCWWLARHTYQEVTIDTGSQPQYPH
jgi:hypothetical protein